MAEMATMGQALWPSRLSRNDIHSRLSSGAESSGGLKSLLVCVAWPFTHAGGSVPSAEDLEKYGCREVGDGMDVLEHVEGCGHHSGWKREVFEPTPVWEAKTWSHMDMEETFIKRETV